MQRAPSRRRARQPPGPSLRARVVDGTPSTMARMTRRAQTLDQCQPSSYDLRSVRRPVEPVHELDLRLTAAFGSRPLPFTPSAPTSYAAASHSST